MSRRTDPAHRALLAMARRLDGAEPACARSADRWFSSDPDDQRRAAAACAWCPARDPCTALADAVRPSHGVWAGVAHDTAAPTRADRHRRIDLHDQQHDDVEEQAHV